MKCKKKLYRRQFLFWFGFSLDYWSSGKNRHLKFAGTRPWLQTAGPGSIKGALNRDALGNRQMDSIRSDTKQAGVNQHWPCEPTAIVTWFSVREVLDIDTAVRTGSPVESRSTESINIDSPCLLWPSQSDTAYNPTLVYHAPVLLMFSYDTFIKVNIRWVGR